MTDVVGNPEEERRAAFYHEPWSQEAVSRYFYCKVRKCRLIVFYTLLTTTLNDVFMFFFFSVFPRQIQQRRQELEQALAVRNT